MRVPHRVQRLLTALSQRRERGLVLSSYVHSPPSSQNAIDIFKGEWSSRLPVDAVSGPHPLFEDERIAWAIGELGGVDGKRILDLGPLEGAHATMFERAGAGEILSVEANTRAFLKCLITKELVGLKRVNFMCGDFVEYLRHTSERFDVVNASGVLYHMKNPAELIALISKVTPAVTIWTHFYSEEELLRNPNLHGRISPGIPVEHEGFRHTLHRQYYGEALGWTGFCGAGAPDSYWMEREDILNCLKFFGLEDVRVNFEMPDNKFGPCFALVATCP